MQEILLTIFTPINILVVFFGSFVGMLVGAMPGMGTTLAIVLVLPLSYNMGPVTAIMMLLSVYQSAGYGGSISAITLGIPGTPSAAATVIDGLAMARKGEPGKALRFALIASSIGGLFGGLVLMFLTKPIGEFSIIFSAPDFCMLGIVAIIAVISLSSGNMAKGLLAIVLGLMIGVIGTDGSTGAARYIFGFNELRDGFNSVALAVAVFALPEVLSLISESLHVRYVANSKSLKSKITFSELKANVKSILIGGSTGTVIGIFPGLGAAISAWFALLLDTKTSKFPEKYGTGISQGICAPESANNACVGGALIPYLALGLPGSAAIAIIGSAFMMHGIQVGPNLFTHNTELVSSILYGFPLTVIAMLILGWFLTPFFARVLVIPNSTLIPFILIFSYVGVYAGNKLFFHVAAAIVLGIICYFLKLINIPLAPMMISYVLAPTIENNFRRALELGSGSYSIFWKTTCSKVILVCLVIVCIIPIIKGCIKKIKSKKAKEMSN